MIDQSNYAIQAEQNIWNLESDRTEKESRIWVQNLQYEFEKEFGLLPEHQAMLLHSKKKKIPRISSELELVQHQIERIEDNLLESLKKRKELQMSLRNAKEDLSSYKQKLKTQKEDHETLEAHAEMEYERFMTVGY